MFKVCPKCGSITEYNAYYGRFTCTTCIWEGLYKDSKTSNKKKYTILKEK